MIRNEIMRNSKTLWLSFGFLLVGCNSFNRIEIRDDPLRPYPYFTADGAVGKEKKEGVRSIDVPACPPYQLPVLPKRPELPYSAIAAIKPGDKDAVDEIYSRHIAELRKHSSTVESLVRSSYHQYMDQCGKFIAKQSLEK
jgi:hypothetical protein